MKKVLACMGTLLCTRRRSLAAFGAALLLAFSVSVGALGAKGAGALGDMLSGSEILGRLLSKNTSAAPDWLSQSFTDPESAQLFLRYVDALAPAITKLSVTPKGEALQFAALLQSARESGVTLLRFSCNANGERVSVICEAPSAKAVRSFEAALRSSGEFQQIYPISIPDFSESHANQFTVFADL